MFMIRVHVVVEKSILKRTGSVNMQFVDLSRRRAKLPPEIEPRAFSEPVS
jgi:hypothetical protein